MEDSSRWLSATMIFWLPVIYMTTYLGFFEAFELAKSRQLFSLDYPENYPVLLIIPAMIPTIFTAYTVINKKRLMFNLIIKANLFHEEAESGGPVKQGMLTDSEFDKLPLDDKYQYCIDLKMSGEYGISSRLREKLYLKYVKSKVPRDRAIAYMARSGSPVANLSDMEEFEYSKLAFEEIKDEIKDRIHLKIMYTYCVDSIALGYEKSIRLIEEIESELSPEFDYWKLRLHILKLRRYSRMDPNFVVDFDQIESMMNLHRYNTEELRLLEASFATLRKEILLKQDRLDEFEELTLNKMYLHKWTGKTGLLASRRNDLGRLYRKQKKFDESLEILNQNLSLYVHTKHRVKQGIALVNIAKTYFAMEDFQKSLETSEKSLTMSKELGRTSTQIESLTIVVKSLEKLGLENQEQKSELEELINLHGIEADPD